MVKKTYVKMTKKGDDVIRFLVHLKEFAPYGKA
jgi:hypothetical protein